jgi:predicted Fe-Mo cluster-binding NifX family protein
MRIAVVSDDGNTISAHFGRARYYVVLEVAEGQIRSQETREKPGHHTFHQKHGHDHHDEHGEHGHGEGHGMGEGAQSRHKAMVEVVLDCEAILARGMGRGAYLHMQQAGIKPVVTDIEGIQEAVGAYIDGRLIDHAERLH